MGENNIYAGIVSYNPDIQRIKENILSIHNQVPMVFIFDNGSYNIEELRNVVKIFKNVNLIESAKNVGIAKGLNELMSKSKELGANWVITLDQDSVCPSNYVATMKEYLHLKPNLGIVAPVIEDRNVGIIGHNPVEQFEDVRTCITSGAFTSVNVWEEIKGFDESMFIDSVDFEYCFRVRKYGYSIIQVRDVKLLHKIGKSKKCRFLFWNINVMGHSSFRKYFIARNNIYYPLKHKQWIMFIRGNVRNLVSIFICLIYENSKEEKIKAILRGWINGISKGDQK